MAYGTTPTGSDTIPLGSVYVPGTSGGNMTPLQGGTSTTDSNSNASAPVMAQLAPTSVVHATLQSAATATGNGLTLSLLGMASCAFTVTGTFVGTITFKGISQDGATTTALNCVQRGSGIIASTATTIGIYDGSVSNLSAVEAVITAYTSGSITVTAAASPVPVTPTTVLIASNQTAIPISGSITASNASVGTDGSAIPTSSTLIGASDGTNLQPLQVDGSHYLKVNVAAGSLSASNPSVSTDGSALPTSSTLIGASDGTNLQQLLVESATNRNLRTGIYSGANEATVTASNALKVDGSAVTQPVSGTVAATQSGAWTVQPGNTANTTPWLVQQQTGTAGGSTPYHSVVSSGTNGTVVKGSAGQVYDGAISNTSSAAVYLRLYDVSSTPTVGTTTIKRTIQVPGNGTVILSWPNGLQFSSGIAYGITTAIADTDTSAISASVSIDLGYR